jgi:hypothetical protein
MGKKGGKQKAAANVVKESKKEEGARFLRRAASEPCAAAAAGMGVDSESSESEAPVAFGPVAPPIMVGSQAYEPDSKRPNLGTATPEAFNIGTPGASPSGPAVAASWPPGLMEMLATIQHGIAKNNSLIEAQDAKVVHLNHTIIDSVGALDTRFEDFKAEVNEKFAKLAVSPNTGSSSSAAAPQASAPKAAWVWTGDGNTKTSASAAAPVAAKPAPSSHGPAPSAATSPEFGRRVFALGFPRKLPSSALRSWWEAEKAKMASHLVTDAVFQGGHGSTFKIMFPSRDAAKLFTASFRSNEAALQCQWTSTREGEGSYPISFRPERTLPERDRGRALSKAWGLVSPIVGISPNWKEGMKLTTDPKSGTINVMAGQDMWELVALKPSAGGYEVIAFDKNLAYFNVGFAVAEMIRASTAAVAKTSAADTMM